MIKVRYVNRITVTMSQICTNGSLTIDLPTSRAHTTRSARAQRSHRGLLLPNRKREANDFEKVYSDYCIS